MNVIFKCRANGVNEKLRADNVAIAVTRIRYYNAAPDPPTVKGRGTIDHPTPVDKYTDCSGR